MHRIYAPDGIERLAGARVRRVEVEGFMVCAIDDIIASKRSGKPPEGPRVDRAP